MFLQHGQDGHQVRFSVGAMLGQAHPDQALQLPAIVPWILERARCTDRLGVCFDTCHALAAGYDLRSEDAFHATFADFERVVGLERLRAFHLNDSRGGLGSRKDRHEHIGRGEIGLEAFRLLLNDPRFTGLPMVLETPKGEDLVEDRENLRVLRSLVQKGKRGRGS